MKKKKRYKNKKYIDTHGLCIAINIFYTVLVYFYSFILFLYFTVDRIRGVICISCSNPTQIQYDNYIISYIFYFFKKKI